jgi:uncharacterized protein YcbK (DUF882 family)
MTDQSSIFPAFIRAEYDATGGGFRQFEQEFAASAGRAKRQFEASFSEVQNIVSRALTVPRNQSGSLDLGVDQIRAAATATEARAIAAREVANATRLAAEAEGDYSAKARAAIAATQALAREEEAAALAARSHATAVEQVQNQLNRTSSATQHVTEGFGRQARGLGQMRQVYIQTGAQMQDLVISLIGGQKAGVVFAQQLPQLAFALSSMGIQADGTQKGIGRFATLLSGPYSVALAGAAYVVGTLVGKLWEQDEASKAAEDAAKKHRDAIVAMQESLAQSIMSLQDKAKATYIEAEADRVAEINIRKKLAAQLEYSKALLEAQKTRAAAGGQRGEVAALGVETRAADVTRLDKQLQDNQTKLAAATQAATTALGNLQKQVIDDLKTPEGRVNSKYEKKINQAVESGAGADAIARLTFARDAELKVIQASQKAVQSHTAARDNEAATVNQVSKLLLRELPGTVTSGARNAAENKRAGGSSTSYHLRGQAIDFVPAGGMDSVSKADIRAWAEKNDLVLKELLGPGDKGHKDHFHIAWEGGKNEINSQRINDGLAREQERIAKEQARAAEEIVQVTTNVISKYDEARAATIAYADALAEIDKAEKGGGLSKNDADLYRQRASQKEQQRLSDGVLSGVSDTEQNRITSQWEEMVRTANRPMEEAAKEAADNLYAGARAIDDVFGRKFSGLIDQIVSNAANDNGSSGIGNLIKGFGKGQNDFTAEITKGLDKTLSSVFGSGGGFGQAMGTVFEGAQFGSQMGSIFTDILGIKGSKTGGLLGGGGGAALGLAIGGPAGAAIGAIAGGILGSTIGGLFKKTPRVSANIGMGADGKLTITGISSNKASLNDAAEASGSAVLQSVENIAKTLGGRVDASRGSVSIGISGDSYHVDTTGQGRLKKSQGGIDFDDNYEAAVQFATMDLIKDGVITGLRASTQRLVQSGKDMGAAIEKAVNFESVFTRLKQYEDPTGAALDALDKSFSQLKDIFAEAGASTEEYASLEKLYGIERAAAVKEAGEKVTASLKGLFDDLTTGNDALSLRTRKGFAQATYDGLATRVAAGDKTAYDDFSTAASTLLDIERQISGSTTDYFTLLDQVTNLTKTRIDSETNVASIAAGRDSLFGTNSASSVAPMVTATETQTAVLGAQLVAVNDNLKLLYARFPAVISQTARPLNDTRTVDNF